MKKFSDAVGAEGMKKLSSLGAAAIESSQTNVFQFNPRLSYVEDGWKKADAFWNTTAAKAAAPAKKTEEKKP
jgi:hypothetical protein